MSKKQIKTSGNIETKNDQMSIFIEDTWPSYHDNASNEQIIFYFNNGDELSRINRLRKESIPMEWFNLMLIKAIYERNSHLYEQCK